MTDYQIVFCDIDGTLLNKEHNLLFETKQAVSALVKKGILFIPTTGRTPLSVERILKEIGVKMPYIASNGGFVCDENAEPLLEKGFDFDEIITVRQAMKEIARDAEATFFCAKKWIADKADSVAIKQEINTVKQNPLVGKAEDFIGRNEKIQKLLYLEPRDKMTKVCERLKKRFPDFKIFLTYENFMEVMPSGISKAVGAKELCRRLNVNPKQTVMFGDGFNDLEMFDFSGHSVAMGNASENVKKKAKEVIGSCDGPALAEKWNEMFNLGLSF